MEPQSTGRYVTTTVTTTVASESVDAFVPDPLPPRFSPQALATLTELLHEAEAALARLDLAADMVPSLDWFIYAFDEEALLLGEIEGTQATLADVLAGAYRAAGRSNVADVEEVVNYVAAVNHAFSEIHADRGAPISIRLFNDCHRILMRGVRGANKQPGEPRRSQNWIGGSRPGNAVFVPPPPGHVPDLVGDLERYIHTEDAMNPLLRVGLVHAQFETIDPDLDGSNGRLGRMLITLLLDQWQLLKSPLLYLSLDPQAEPGRLLPLARRRAQRGRLDRLAALLS
ncbi:MAG: Fic/DOC family N-terminal domain-containing protein [Halioglobus sp.]|nr:Fic/DOC family N-terminal domain-containing protein [Halioglobus sp.]